MTQAIRHSRFLAERTVLPPSIALRVFGPLFEVEEADGVLRAVLRAPDGATIMRADDPSTPADPDQALERYILEHFPERDAILKASAAGSGAAGNQDKASPRRVIPRDNPKALGANLEAVARGEVDVR